MADSILTTGEKAIFDEILSTLSGTENTNAFRDEYPDVFPDESVDYMWTAYFEGGGPADEIWQIPGGSWSINGAYMFDGVYKTKDQAYAHAIALKAAFPLRTLTNVRNIHFVNDPRITRDVVKRKADQTESGDLRVWRLIIEFGVEMRYA